jgi:hypothetical protein
MMTKSDDEVSWKDIDYIPMEREDGKYRLLKIIIEDDSFILNKFEVGILLEILEREYEMMYMDENLEDSRETIKQYSKHEGCP